MFLLMLFLYSKQGMVINSRYLLMLVIHDVIMIRTNQKCYMFTFLSDSRVYMTRKLACLGNLNCSFLDAKRESCGLIWIALFFMLLDNTLL